MSFKIIKELRQAGKLDDALRMATQALAAEPGYIWNKRAAAWVYYDFLKKFSAPDLYDSFIEYLLKLRDLELPADETMVYDSCAWQIGKVVFGLQRAEHVDYKKINKIFEIIKDFHFTKPSEAYSFIYKAFHTGYPNWSAFLKFADWWNFENFRAEDYLSEEYNGKSIMSLVEQAYIAYSKKLLEGEPIHPFGQQNTVDRDKIQSFLTHLEKIISNNPDYLYPPYFKAKLLLVLGDDENVLSAFLPFARQKRNDFWVWALMAEIFSNDRDIQFSCYCKALSLKTPEDFIVKLRLAFAGLLVEMQMYGQAKTEILQIKAIREKNEWKLPSQLIQWTQQEWYKFATENENNNDLYTQNLKRAEEILYQDIPEEIIVVEFVNENKNILSFVKNKNKFGFFNYSYHLNKPQIGDILSVRFNGDGNDRFYKILAAKKVEPNTTSEATKVFEGTLTLNSSLVFGFIEDVFVEPKLVKDKKLTNGQALKGTAILSFNKKRNEWGWKAIELK